MKQTDLLPCPFCGREATYTFDPDGVKDTEGRFWGYQVTCNSCCATTGLCFSQNMTREAWNRREVNETD